MATATPEPRDDRRRWFERRSVPALGALLAILVAIPVLAATPTAVRLSDAERSDVARVEAYLTAIGTLEARFVQFTSTGGYSEGVVYLARPGRMRIQYDPPVPIEIVADGRTLVYHDKKLKQVSYLGIDATPAGILLAPTVRFAGAVTLVGFAKTDGALRLTLVKTDDPLAGSVTLVLEDQPLILKKWEVTDAQGVITSVSLFDPRFGTPLDGRLFRLPEPYPTEHRE